MSAGKDQIASTSARWDAREMAFRKSAAVTEHAGSNFNPWAHPVHAAIIGEAKYVNSAALKDNARMVQRLTVIAKHANAKMLGVENIAAHAV